MQFAFKAQNGDNELGTEGKFSWGKFGRRSGDGGAFGNDEQYIETDSEAQRKLVNL
jgi:hypothetical protein